MLGSRKSSTYSVESTGLPQLTITVSRNPNDVPAQFKRSLARLQVDSDPDSTPVCDKLEIIHFDLRISLEGLTDFGRLKLCGLVNQKSADCRTNRIEAEEWMQSEITLSLVVYKLRYLAIFMRHLISDLGEDFALRLVYSDTLMDLASEASREYVVRCNSSSSSVVQAAHGTQQAPSPREVVFDRRRLSATSPLMWSSTSPRLSVLGLSDATDDLTLSPSSPRPTQFVERSGVSPSTNKPNGG